MRLSESLRRGIVSAASGGIKSRFKIRERRITLFFEDIIAGYIKSCEDEGHADEMIEIGRRWGFLSASALIPDAIKRLPAPLFSMAAKKVWVNAGLVENVDISRKGDRISMTTYNEAITRVCKNNAFVPASFAGVLEGCLGREVETEKITQEPGKSSYVFRVTGKRTCYDGREKSQYNSLNTFENVKGFTLKAALRAGIFRLNGNRIYFRGRPISYSENTLFHLIGNRGILMDRVAGISKKYFGEILDLSAGKENLLQLLKTLLQVMGWGHVKIKTDGKQETIMITNLPCGLQEGEDSWDFLTGAIEGYLTAVERNTRVSSSMTGRRSIKIECRAV